MPNHSSPANSPSNSTDPLVRVAKHLDSTNESDIVLAVRRRLRGKGMVAKSECDYTAVEVERDDRVDLLLVDSGWVFLASSAANRMELLRDLPVPSAALAAILPGRLAELDSLDASLGTWRSRPDGVLVLDDARRNS